VLNAGANDPAAWGTSYSARRVSTGLSYAYSLFESEEVESGEDAWGIEYDDAREKEVADSGGGTYDEDEVRVGSDGCGMLNEVPGAMRGVDQ
jgi:hypothetical protein